MAEESASARISRIGINKAGTNGWGWRWASTMGVSLPIAMSFQEPGTFLVQASGQVTYDESQALLAELVADPRMRSGTQLLVDSRTVVAAPTTPELRRIAGDLLPLVERGMGPIAIVTESPSIYGIARMFSVFAELVNAHVMPFRCMIEAQRWLETHPHTQN